ncbi:hypothetical protein [Pelagibacterium sediminicola]|uniref:hypothetical protein n=1 Tax=Pelagibacterium sediminicola TaxID=2248761 RepID=UPI000E316AA1|nr:hypothetical protein [Pelagibacterium sediminicola]
MAKLRMIHVDAKGIAPDGETFTNVAAPEMVAAGYMLNEPVLLRFPDGLIVRSTQVRITPAGMDYLQRRMTADALEQSRHGGMS